MCMSCGTDLGFPEVRYLPENVQPRPVAAPAAPPPAAGTPE
jgi:hypothetical protein